MTFLTKNQILNLFVAMKKNLLLQGLKIKSKHRGYF